MGSKIARFCELASTSTGKPLNVASVKLESDHESVTARFESSVVDGKTRIRLAFAFETSEAIHGKTIKGSLVGRQDGHVLFAVPYTAIPPRSPENHQSVSENQSAPENQTSPPE